MFPSLMKTDAIWGLRVGYVLLQGPGLIKTGAPKARVFIRGSGGRAPLSVVKDVYGLSKMWCVVGSHRDSPEKG